MTRLRQRFYPLTVIARLYRAIQHAETVVIHRDAAGYWIPRLRGE